MSAKRIAQTAFLILGLSIVFKGFYVAYLGFEYGLWFHSVVAGIVGLVFCLGIITLLQVYHVKKKR